MSNRSKHRCRNRWACTVAVALVATCGCLPRGPISIGWPWRHSAKDCPDCDGAGDGMAVSAPHSLFHPVPTRPVFTPWLVDDSPQPSHGTIATRRPSEKSLDKPELPPSDAELAERRSAVRSTAAHSTTTSSSSAAPRSAATSGAADDYYNPSSESAGGIPAAPSGPSSGQWRASPSGS